MPGIVVAGDASVDWYLRPKAADDQARHNWRLRPGSQMLVRPGGALLLAEMVKAAAGSQTTVASQGLRGLPAISPQRCIRSYAQLGPFPADHEHPGDQVHRVANALGFQGPASGQPLCPSVKDDIADAALVILDDAGNGFRDDPGAWPQALGNAAQPPLVIYKTCLPLAQGRLWESLSGELRQRLIVVVNVDDLRQEGVHISRRLSWDRTALDFAWQVRYHHTLRQLTQCAHLIVRVGLDGALLCSQQDGQPSLTLYFDPQGLEDGFDCRHPGRMLGYANAFVAALAAQVNSLGLDGLKTGIRYGLQCSRRLLRLGFGPVGREPALALGEIFPGTVDLDEFSSVPVDPQPATGDGAPQCRAELDCWSIIKAGGGPALEDIATEIVLNGPDAALRRMPVGSFGALKTVDKCEIESFQSVRNLMAEYLANQEANRPLSLAVFGPPGSGKSFGVTEVAKSLSDPRIETVVFNVAQFVSIQDLASAFHRVRDLAIKGRVPLTFFDEFDSSFQRENLGWLKYFLSPMQDGEFKEGDSTHPLGKAIFVFAGGTATSFEAFGREGEKEPLALQTFRDAKGPDFVSRLRGHINILGTDPQAGDGHLFMVRRALLLRSLLQRKAKHLIDGKQACHIEAGVLAAFLKVGRYKHGARSMEAILDMSLLNGRKAYEPAALPSQQQLSMHVDAAEFCDLVSEQVSWAARLETLARAVHEKYLLDQKGRKPPTDPSMQPWDRLREDLKQSNREQANDIPAKLRAIGYGIRQSGTEPVRLILDAAQIETLARMEHERWNKERQAQGWVYGPTRDHNRRTSPHLLPWNELPEDVKTWDREAVEAIPVLLKMAGFEVYKLKK